MILFTWDNIDGTELMNEIISLLIIFVTVEACERRFSILKLIKTCLRTTMTNKRLNNLAILSIKNEIASNINTIENI